MEHVILGAGPAGVIAAETLRRADPDGAITLIGAEPEPPYARMAIPYLLAGGIDEAGTHLRKAPDHFDRLGIRVRRARATALAAKARTVSLDDGATLHFDRLLIATGSHPVRPEAPGMDLPGVHACWTLADARAIVRHAVPGSNVLLIGAAFVACIILQALVSRGLKVNVIVRGDRMIRRMADLTTARMVRRWCETRGVRVMTETRLESIEPSGRAAEPLRVTLDSGERLDVSLVVVAAGVAPNADFLADTGVTVEHGVVVDSRLETAVPGIYAAGDVAQGPTWPERTTAVQAIQTTAAEHGRIAALNMAGRPSATKGTVGMNVLDAVGLISTSFGRWQGVDGGDFADCLDEGAWKYVRLAFDGDRLVGAITVGRTEGIGVLRGLIQAARPLGPWKARLMADPTRFVEAYVGLNVG